MKIELEKLLGKKAREITFYEEIQKMINFANKKNDKDTYKRLAEHYTTLTQVDGIREDALKVAKYFSDKAAEMK